MLPRSYSALSACGSVAGCVTTALIYMTPLRPCAAALALSIGLLPLVPAEHVHGSVSAGGHHDVVAHRHLGSHHIHSADHDLAAARDHDLFPYDEDHDAERHAEPGADHDADHEGGRAGYLAAHDPAHNSSRADYCGDRVEAGPASTDSVPRFDDDDSVVATEDCVFVAASTFVLAVPTLASQPTTPVTDARPAAGPGELIERLIHGPPRAPTLLRGPPSLSRL